MKYSQFDATPSLFKSIILDIASDIINYRSLFTVSVFVLFLYNIVFEFILECSYLTSLEDVRERKEGRKTYNAIQYILLQHNVFHHNTRRMYIPVYVRLPVSATSSLPCPAHLYDISGNPALPPEDLNSRKRALMIQR